MKVTAAVVALSGLVSFAVAGADDYFTMLAARSASPIHLRPVTANGGKLWIGKNTAAYCPGVVRQEGGCPTPKGKKPVTAFAGGDGSLAMAVVVPGGQLVYIDPTDGSVSFTQAHSADMPQGAITNGWNLEENVISGTSGILSWRRGLLACPDPDAEDVYQVFAALKDLDFSDDCLGFNGITANRTRAGAWQYT